MAQDSLPPSQEHPIPVTFGIYGGVDHYNSWGTEAVFGASIDLTLPRHITLSTQLYADHSLSWLIEADHSFTPWFSLGGGYILNRYSQYKTDEHNLFLTTNYHYKTRPIGIGGSLGWNNRWVVFDTEDPYFAMFTSWEIALLTTPIERWELNLILSNSHNNIPVSAGYLEIALTNKVSLNTHLALTFDIGIAPSGFLSAAGYIDRFFSIVGVTYAL